MTDPNHKQTTGVCDLYFAKLMVALELRRTHGVIFAAAFLDQFGSEIGRAASKGTQLSGHDNK